MPLALKVNILIRGALREPDPENPGQTVRVVYQRVARGLGQRRYSTTRDIQRRLWVQTPDPKTPAKLALQERFRNAVANYHTLAPAEITALRERGKRAKLTAINQHIREWCRANPIDTAPLLQRRCYVTTSGTIAIMPNPGALNDAADAIATINLKRWRNS